MPARTPSALASAAVAALVLVIGCSKGGSGAGASTCGTPTRAQCLDAAWLASDPCGVAEREAMRVDAAAFCNQVVVEASQAATEDLVPETVVDPNGGGTALAKVVPNASDGVDEILMPQTQVGLEQRAAMLATPSGLSTTEQALRAQWAANGSRVASCREYVYEKYLDDTRFEDAVAGRHDDFPYVYDVAFGPAAATTSIGSRVIAGQPLKMRDGSDMTVQSLAGRPHHALADCTPSYGPPGSEFYLKNVFAAVPRAVFERVRAQVDTGTAMFIEYSRCYERVADAPAATPGASWQWHRDRRAAVLARGISLAEMDAWYADVKAFQQALVAYEKPRPACCVTEPSMPCCTDYQATRASLEAWMGALFLKAYRAGCVGLDAAVCDWSPGYFVDDLRGTYGAAKEADYQRCVDRTKDDFAALAPRQFRMPNGSLWQTPMDYTGSARDIDRYFEDQALWLAAFYQALPADVKDPATGAFRPPGGERSAHHEAGNSLFAAYYDYLLAWGSPELGPRPANPSAPCVKRLEARGSFTAGARAFGSLRTDVLDASFGADLANGVGGHLTVLGVQIWGQASGGWTILSSSFDVSKDLLRKSRTFTVAYIPVTVAGGVSGTLHLEREARLTFVASPLGGGCYDGATLLVRFDPWVQLEAFASAAVGTAVASAGIECALTLLRLETPYDLGVTLAADGGTGKLRLTPSATGDLVVRTLDGRISLFVKVDLGLFDVGYSYDVFRWSGLKAQLPLFRSSYTLVLDDVLPVMAASGP